MHASRGCIECLISFFQLPPYERITDSTRPGTNVTLEEISNSFKTATEEPILSIDILQIWQIDSAEKPERPYAEYHSFLIEFYTSPERS